MFNIFGYHADKEYKKLVKKILKEGVVKEDRTGTGTISIFGARMEFDLQKGFPLLTTKKVPFKVLAEEYLWFARGDTDIKSLLQKNVNIWNDDAYRWYLEKGGTLSREDFLKSAKEDGFDLGAIYGAQWRTWLNGEGIIDQLQQAIDTIQENPDSRRIVVSAWAPHEMDNIALPPCHILFQLYVSEGKLSCQLYQRSGDVFLGVPFNIASYALKVNLIAKMCGLEVGKFVHVIGDAHIYLNHLDQVKEQLRRRPRKMPTLKVKTKREFIEDYTLGDFELIGYDPHPTIKGKVSVGL